MSGTGSVISQTIAHLPEKEHGSIPTVDYSSIRGKVSKCLVVLSLSLLRYCFTVFYKNGD